MTPKSFLRGLALAGLAMCALCSTARAHEGGGSMRIGSTANGGGTLVADYDFSSAQPVSFSLQIGGTTVYSAIVPSFDSIHEDDAMAGLFALNANVQVRVQLTALDVGKTAMNVNGTQLDAVGESAVLGTGPDFHQHPNLQLLLMLPVGEHGSGKLAFKLTTTASGYSESQAYTLVLSNGHLPAPSYGSVAYDKASVGCQAAIGREGRKLVAAKLTQLEKCLDKVAALRAKEAVLPPVSTASAEKSAQRACGASLVGRLEKALAGAAAKIEKACGSFASADLDPNQIAAHLDLVGCRAEELVGAGYGGAVLDLGEFLVEGTPLSDRFACLGGTTP
jgi:hypothetical protein